MNRRDFLRLRTRGDERELELSCERLYMAYVDAESGARGASGAAAEAPWEGEPPTEIDTPTTDDVFRELERRLAAVDRLRVTGTEWLAGASLRGRLEHVINAFRARGGRVDMPDSAGVSSWG
jgi:hypothetical protein